MAIVASVPHEGFSLSSRPRNDSFLSSGRGGSGNIRRSCISLDSNPSPDPDLISIRNREVPPNPDKFVSSGRGGSGNIRPPSPDLETFPLTAAILSQHVAAQAQYEQQIRKKHAESHVVRSSGRGGSGNISNRRRVPLKRPKSNKGFLPKGRVKAILHGDGASANVQVDNRNEPVGVDRRERSSTLMSSSGTESQHAESSRSSIARSSGSGLVPDQNPWSSSDVAGPTKKKRSFLTRWSKPPSPQQLSVPMESLNIVVGDGHSAELNSHQSQDLPSMQNDDPKESPLSPCSPRTSSPVISTSFSGSHSVRSSRHSALSLPIVPRDQEYVSFLEF